MSTVWPTLGSRVAKEQNGTFRVKHLVLNCYAVAASQRQSHPTPPPCVHLAQSIDVKTFLQGASIHPREMALFLGGSYTGMDRPALGQLTQRYSPGGSKQSTFTSVRFCSPCSGPMTLAGRCLSRRRRLARHSSRIRPALRTISMMSGPRNTKKQ